MKKLKKLRLRIFLFFLALSFSPQFYTHAQEIAVLPGGLGSQPLTGCCVGVDPTLSGGIILRFDQLGFIKRPFEVAGFATSKWVEFTLGPTFEIYGERPLIDPGTGLGLSITRVSDMNITASFGAGLLSLSSRTVEYDLPAQISAFIIYGRAHLSYSLNDRWALILVPGIGFSIAQNYLALNWNASLGPQFRF
jgi:hypothetical protein